jgi:hypothetical protein
MQWVENGVRRILQWFALAGGRPGLAWALAAIAANGRKAIGATVDARNAGTRLERLPFTQEKLTLD